MAPRHNRDDDVAVGDAGLERLGAGVFDGGNAVIGNKSQHLDELPVAIRMVLQAGAHLGEGRRQSPVLEGRAVP
jgi:hypothetical protein